MVVELHFDDANLCTYIKLSFAILSNYQIINDVGDRIALSALRKNVSRKEELQPHSERC